LKRRRYLIRWERKRERTKSTTGSAVMDLIPVAALFALKLREKKTKNTKGSTTLDFLTALLFYTFSI